MRCRRRRAHRAFLMLAASVAGEERRQVRARRSGRRPAAAAVGMQKVCAGSGGKRRHELARGAQADHDHMPTEDLATAVVDDGADLADVSSNTPWWTDRSAWPGVPSSLALLRRSRRRRCRASQATTTTRMPTWRVAGLVPWAEDDRSDRCRVGCRRGSGGRHDRQQAGVLPPWGAMLGCNDTRRRSQWRNRASPSSSVSWR